MKFFLTATALLIISGSTFAQNLTWNNPIEVSSGGTYGSTRPRITTCNGTPVIVWSNESTKKVYASRLVGSMFTTPVLVTPGNLGAFAADWTGPEIDALGNTIFVTFTDNITPPGPAYVVRSTDGGMTFGDTVRVPLMGDELPRFPTVQVMPDGNPMVAIMKFDGSFANPVNVVSLSTDGGNSFSPYVNATGIVPGEPCDCCPISLVANSDVAAVLFRNNDSNIRDTWAALSFDDASTFTTPTRVDSNNWMLMSCPSTGPDGYIFGDTLVSVFMNGAGSNGNKVYIASMDHNTMQVQPQQQVYNTGTNANQNFPRIAGVGDTLGVVWRQMIMPGSEVMFAHSYNGPNGIGLWIDTLTIGMSGSQVNPDIAYGDDKMHVTFEDQSSGKIYYMNAELPQAPNSTSTISDESGFSIIQESMDRLLLYATKSLTTSVTVSIFDVLGKVIFEKQTTELSKSDSASVNTSQLASGSYFVVVESGKTPFTQKINIIR